MKCATLLLSYTWPGCNSTYRQTVTTTMVLRRVSTIFQSGSAAIVKKRPPRDPELTHCPRPHTVSLRQDSAVPESGNNSRSSTMKSQIQDYAAICLFEESKLTKLFLISILYRVRNSTELVNSLDMYVCKVPYPLSLHKTRTLALKATSVE